MGVRLLFVGVTALMIAIGATANADTIGIATGASSNWLTSPVFEPISLPEILRPTLDVDHEEPASAEEPANVQDSAVHPDEVLKALQESVERLSAAGLAEEAAAATSLLQQFEQKYHARLILALQSSESAEYRSELDRLQRRLAKFDIGAEEERRLQLASKLREAESEFPGFHYQMSDKWLDSVSPTRRQSVLESPQDSVQSDDKDYEKSVHLIDDITTSRRKLDSTNWKGDFSIRRY